MSVLPDTSVWTEFFRGTEPTARAPDRLIAEQEPVICGPILAELLAGTPSAERERLWVALAGLPFLELTRARWREAGELAHELVGRGSCVPLIDVLIPVAAAHAGAALWTRDRAFDRIADVLPELALHS